MKSLKAQLLSALVVMWIGLLALAAWSAFSARETMIEERKDGLRRVVEAANGVVNSYVADVAAGKISKEEAQKNGWNASPPCATTATTISSFSTLARWC